MRKEAERCGALLLSRLPVQRPAVSAPVSSVRRVWVNRTADGSAAERVIFDARFGLSPVVGVWAGTEVPAW
eukprot:11193247-Lingulodinium_polyedra.AAC.1